MEWSIDEALFYFGIAAVIGMSFAALVCFLLLKIWKKRLEKILDEAYGKETK